MNWTLFSAVVLVVLIALMAAGLFMNQEGIDNQGYRWNDLGPKGLVGEVYRLRPGDPVTYRGQRFTVKGSLYLHEGADRWRDHFLRTESGGSLRLSVADRDDAVVVIWLEMPADGLDPGRASLLVDGVEYHLAGRGTAKFQSAGATSVGWVGEVEYVRYETRGGRRLLLERSGQAGWRAAVSEPASLEAITVFAPPPGADD